MTRRFDPTPLDPAQVDELLDLARRAPSAGFSQGVHLLALTGPTLQRFWATTGGDRWFEPDGVLSAPLVVLPLADPTAYTARYAEPDKIQHGLHLQENWSVPFWITDAGMAVENLLLLVEERGLGALYFGLTTHVREAFDELGIPSHVLQVGAVAVGRRAVDDRPSGSPRTRSRRPTVEVVHHNHW